MANQTQDQNWTDAILAAIEFLKKNPWDKINNSRRYHVSFNNESFPPKVVYAKAAELFSDKFPNGHIPILSGGKKTNEFIQKMGFHIIENQHDPLSHLISKYKAYVKNGGLQDEIYKWKLLYEYRGRPDTKALNFLEEIKAINFANLIYPVGQAVVKHLAEARPEEYRKCFEVLFDETIPLQERISFFNTETLKVYRQIVPEERFSHHQDERTISTFLTYHNPDLYTFYKDSFYQKLTALLEIKAEKAGKKLLHYYTILNQIIDDYIKDDVELIGIVKNALPPMTFSDNSHKILVQDILYQGLDKNFGEEKKYWRIGTSDEETSYWEEMKNENKISIGWPKLGDLNEFDVRDKYVIMARFNGIGYYKDSKQNVISRKAGEIYDFYKNININDIVLAQAGHGVLAIGVVRDDYSYNPEKEFPHQKSVDWLVFPEHFINPTGPNTSVYRITDKKIISTIQQLMEQQQQELKIIKPNMKNALNQILYGPPGTGKTYSTIEKALSIIDGSEEGILKKGGRTLLKKRFEELVNAGQIVFTTFHQSMSYEDFIEGIKPKTVLNEVKYEIEDGIFKKICQTARIKVGNLETVIEKFKIDVSEEDGKAPLTINGKGTSFDVIYRGTNVFYVQPHNSTKENPWYAVNINNIRKAFETDSYANMYNPTYIREIINYLLTNYDLVKGKNEISKNYVLIIDEINRGNVSQILGELITLIEEDKRLGKSEALEVTLPYSKEKFGVPPNLYIIGTMNTADRSVEALDTALRRRFSFEEMPPKYKLPELEYEVYGYQASEILKIINHRIEKLLDRDHAIGHSYFINKDEETIVESFYKCIIPLLQEYFFGDYGKIGLVLGKGFISKKEWDKSSYSFADFDYEGSGDFDEKEVYRIIDYRSDELSTLSINKQDVSMDFGKAIQLLMKGSVNG